MHEYGIGRAIVRRAVAEAAGHNAARITGLHVRVGPQGAASREALALGIQAAAHGTIAEDAVVRIGPADEGGVVLESVDLVGLEEVS